uniref:Uncharacterized protein n=1 Tax=Romanomermis culicivorax TaxID=13658 RepID=A0A915KZQ7_ROMCU
MKSFISSAETFFTNTVKEDAKIIQITPASSIYDLDRSVADNQVPLISLLEKVISRWLTTIESLSRNKNDEKIVGDENYTTPIYNLKADSFTSGMLITRA